MSLAFQISHAELLLLLGLLELPRPFALGQGTLPARPALEGALSAAAGSLVARNLLVLPASPESPPTPHAALADMLRTVALADSLLIVASGPPTQLGHISRAGNRFVLHSSPAPDVHRFEALTGADQVTGTMLGMLAPANLREPERQTPLLLNGETLLTAFNALQHNDEHMAVWVLEQQGHPTTLARSFVTAIGPQPARYALAAIRHMRQPQPEARGALLIAGRNGGWWAVPASDRDDRLALWPVGGDSLRQRIGELGAWICEAA
ncbi:hypothetical protein A6A03_10205 [Chloroflexus islandicus]|uniref:ESX secretion-associated protein EspG n=1 Tax=Chloroflexus islandicus TaxID=1707952 RepID=A0A178MFB1_9CHLR|nr:hypothetical protein [Chloroflexus islandicus]OAN47441.1 hypothetical protein A6A03_10205 [Chloroflexus islandicus]